MPGRRPSLANGDVFCQRSLENSDSNDAVSQGVVIIDPCPWRRLTDLSFDAIDGTGSDIAPCPRETPKAEAMPTPEHWRRRKAAIVRCIWNGSTEPYSPNPRSELSVPACGWVCSMTKSRSQELSEKAAAERRRCRDWLLPFMQDNQPKFLTKDELRVVAIRQLNVSKSSRGSMLSRKWAVTIGTSPCADGRASKASRFPIRELATVERFAATSCGYRRCRAMSPIGGKAENMCSRRVFPSLTRNGL